MNFPEDVPNYSQSFMSLLTKCIISSRLVLIHCLFTLFQPSYLFLQQYPFFQFLQSKLDLNIQAATPNSSLLAYALIFPAFLFLGENRVGHEILVQKRV